MSPGPLLIAVATLTAVAAGVTGAWSPCGFSMVDTLGEAGRGRRAMRAACATFTAGAVAGGVVTFGALALLGAALRLEGAGAGPAVAMAVALLAAAGEAAGVRVMPQVRRQVPERWRRVMPLSLAAGLYGLLLGLGVTTFVLTLAVWALAGINVALGSPLLGLAVGVGFGAGRALPVVAMAPRMAGAGGRMMQRMVERPGILRRLRLADAALLAALAMAMALAGAGPGGGAAAAAPAPSEPAHPARPAVGPAPGFSRVPSG